jgi:hypothetical protein
MNRKACESRLGYLFDTFLEHNVTPWSRSRPGLQQVS